MSPDSSHTSRLRLLLGAMQGAALHALYQSHALKAWPATEALWFGPMLMAAVLWPLLAISAWGRMTPRRWGLWSALALAVVVALAGYDMWRMAPAPEGRVPWVFPSVNAWVFISAGLFMAQSLVLASAHDRQRVARYPTYFDQSWNLGIQSLFSLLFVGALWLMLWLGAALFSLIGLGFLRRLLTESWFSIPVSAVAMAWALHLTDVKPDIVRGIRGLLLVLLSWLLPLVTLLATGFLVSLPFTGLEPLWATRHATTVLMGTAAALVVLINTAFQSGDRPDAVHKVVRVCARLACALLLPLVALAIHALSLRVSQHGWSGDRVIAAACEGVALAYALGYAWAALSRPVSPPGSQQGWLAPVAWVNVRVSWLILATLLALFSPVLDPARIGVADQMARLSAGRIHADQLDYRYLRFDAGRHGDEALRLLARQGVSGLPPKEAALAAQGAQAALNTRNRYDDMAAVRKTAAMDAATLRRNIKAVWPQGAVLPDAFAQTPWWQERAQNRQVRQLPSCLREAEQSCEAVLLQLDADPRPELLIVQRLPRVYAVVFSQGPEGDWRVVGELPSHMVTCEEHLERLREGRFESVPTPYNDLMLGPVRVPLRGLGYSARETEGDLPKGCH